MWNCDFFFTWIAFDFRIFILFLPQDERRFPFEIGCCVEENVSELWSENTFKLFWYRFFGKECITLKIITSDLLVEVLPWEIISKHHFQRKNKIRFIVRRCYELETIFLFARRHTQHFELLVNRIQILGWCSYFFFVYLGVRI